MIVNKKTRKQSLSEALVRWQPLGFGPLVWQYKTSEDNKLVSWKHCFNIIWIKWLIDHQENNWQFQLVAPLNISNDFYSMN